jgi:hypothetical protein
VLGMLLLRGDEIISLTIEGPPPAEETRPAKQQVAPVSDITKLLGCQLWPCKPVIKSEIEINLGSICVMQQVADSRSR